MKKTRFVIVAALAIAITAIPAYAADKNAILISWDGIQRAHLKECISRNEMPNLQALIKEGKMVDIDVTHVTDTKAGHSQMLTGYDPEVTGVFSNGKFKPIPVGYTIFERLESALGKDKIATVMLTGKTHHIGNCAPKVTVDPKTLDPGYFPGKDQDAKPAETAAEAPAASVTADVTATEANHCLNSKKTAESTAKSSKSGNSEKESANCRWTEQTRRAMVSCLQKHRCLGR